MFQDQLSQPESDVIRTVRYWDGIAETWRETQPQKLWRAHNDAVNAAWLDRWLPEGPIPRLLKTDLFDEAVGEGLSTLLVSRAQMVLGMDLSVQILGAARADNAAILTTSSDARFLPFTSRAFDVVVSNSTLDHFNSQREIVISLREIHRVLHPGGYLLLMLDNLANPAIVLRNMLPFQWLNRLGIVPYWIGATLGPRRLLWVLKQLGFEVLELDTLIHCPRVLATALANLLEKHASSKWQARLFRWLTGFERLSRWPTRFWTGYYLAVRAVRR